MEQNLIKDGHCFKTILPNFCHFFNESFFVDICLVCSNGKVWTYRLLLASISTYLKGPVFKFNFSKGLDQWRTLGVTMCHLYSSKELGFFGMAASCQSFPEDF